MSRRQSVTKHSPRYSKPRALRTCRFLYIGVVFGSKRVMAKRPRSTVTEAQQKFIDAKLEGASDRVAALAAGKPDASGLAYSSTVREQLAAARRWLTDVTQIKRLDVVEGIIDSIEMARMMADPAAVRQGWVEIGKILGHYAPEVKNINLTIGQERLRSKFEALSDDELLALQSGNVVNGEFTQETSH